jgi:adenylate cyclase
LLVCYLSPFWQLAATAGVLYGKIVATIKQMEFTSMSAPNRIEIVRRPISLKIFGIAIGLLLMMIVVTFSSSMSLRAVGQELRLLSEYYIRLDQILGEVRVQSLVEVLQIERVLHAKPAVAQDGAAQAEALFRQAGDCSPDAMRPVSDKIRSTWPGHGEQYLMTYRVRRLCSEMRLARANALVEKALALPQVRARAEHVARFVSIREALKNIPASRAKLHEHFEKYLARMQTADNSALVALQDNIEERRSEVNRHLSGVTLLLEAGTRESAERTNELEVQTQTLSWAVTTAAGLLGLVIAFFITRNLVRPVRELLGLTHAIRAGNLDVQIQIKTNDEIGLLAESFNHMVGEMRQKELITSMFGKYVDPRIVKGLLLNQQSFSHGGERQRMTVFFSDLESFTTACEAFTPSGVVRLLNQYFSLMDKPIRTHHGIVDKYIGDSVMAFWGPPFSAPAEHAAQACFAALDQMAQVPTFQEMLPNLLGIRKNIPLIRVRMGISTGDVTVGSIGSEEVRSYTVIGDNVNLASRLEGTNKHYGTQILISEDTRKEAGDLIEVREIDLIRVVGKHEPARIYELLGRKGQISSNSVALREHYAHALALYRGRQFDAADAAFARCLEVEPGDGPSKVFRRRIEKLRLQMPGEDWDGVWTMTDK